MSKEDAERRHVESVEAIALACQALIGVIRAIAGPVEVGKPVSLGDAANSPMAHADTLPRLQAAALRCHVPAGEASREPAPASEDAQALAKDLADVVAELCSKIEYAAIMLHARNTAPAAAPAGEDKAVEAPAPAMRAVAPTLLSANATSVLMSANASQAAQASSENTPVVATLLPRKKVKM